MSLLDVRESGGKQGERENWRRRKVGTADMSQEEDKRRSRGPYTLAILHPPLRPLPLVSCRPLMALIGS